LGECWIQLNQSDSAIEPLRKAIALAPDDAEAHFILGTALNKSGNRDEGARERQICAQLRAKQRSQGAPWDHGHLIRWYPVLLMLSTRAAPPGNFS
jgi:tetratricopeptide (TPR) repeat protein